MEIRFFFDNSMLKWSIDMPFEFLYMPWHCQHLIFLQIGIDIVNFNPIMKNPKPAERAKPFRLVKYFTFTSLIVIFIGTIILSVLNTHWVRAMQYQKSEEYALLLIENLNHQVFLQFILPVGLKYGKIELRNQEQFERMDSVVRSTLHSFNVEMVNIYSKNDIIAYSFSSELVGVENLGGSSYKNALEGKSTSKLVQSGTLWEIFLGIPKEIKIVTFAPLRAERPLSPISGPVLGVIEIRQDLSSDYRKIFKYQVLVIATISIVMGILLLTLIYVVKRGEGIIEKRAIERLRLKDQLAKSKHLSSLGEMVAGVSHEIRNPLGIISSSAELLKKRMDPRDALNAITDIIVAEARRLNNIITDFLNYARPTPPNRTPCKIDRIITKNIQFLEPQIKKNGYSIKTAFADEIPEIMADGDMLYQAFLNLLINGMQAMPDGGVIEVTIEKEDKALWVLIEDEGVGVPPQVMEKVWDPFFTTKEKGTGLGLGIVRNIIESHDGKIRVDNRKGKGARVTVKFPLDK
jgi:two-component system, NtrC family, sensor histidine kinase HydH